MQIDIIRLNNMLLINQIH